jgi:hypothetical protein
VLSGEVVAHGPDGELLLQPWRVLAAIDDVTADEVRHLYEERFEVAQATQS